MQISYKHQTPNVKLDCRMVVQHFGGVSATAKLFRDHGVSVSIGAIEKWQERGSIPSSHLVHLASIAKVIRVRFDLYDFLTETKENNDSIADGRSANRIVAVAG
jgi:hypothetical protein